MNTNKIITKVYRTAPNFTTYGMQIVVNGFETTLDFEGGHSSPYRKGAAYCTSNHDIQKAIESRKDFGTFITLEYEEIREVETDTPELPVIGGANDVANDGAEEITDTPELPLIGTGVTTAQEAKKWLMENYKVTARELPNKQAILAFAEEKQITFPDWNIE